MRRLAPAALLLALLLLLPPAGSAGAQSRLPEAGRTALAITAGPEFNAAGRFHRGARAGDLDVRSRGWGDVYDYTLGIQGDLAWGLDARSQIGATLGLTTAQGRGVAIGTAAGEELRGRFGDYRAVSLGAYYRRHFEVSPGFLPYLSAGAGVRRVDPIGVTLSSAALPAEVAIPFYRRSWVPTLSLAFGWRQEFQGVALGLETGLAYDFRPRGADAGLAPLGLGRLNDAGDRLYVPVRLLVAF